MPAVELAAAYISIVPSAGGIRALIEKELAPIEATAKAQGDKAGRAFGESFGDKVKEHAGKAGLAASAALTAGFARSLDIGAGTDKMAAQLGLTSQQSGQAGKIAADLYSANFGDSLDQVNAAVVNVSRNVAGMATSSSADMERLTAKTLGLVQVFDQDLAGVTAAAGDLVKTGLAANADEAFDLLTVGFQKGADKAGDFLDTITEYGVQFKKFGLDGATATGLLTQGLAAGARDSDYIADAIKEFSLLAVDSASTAGEGFAAIGLDARTMAANIAAGGPTATAALDQTLDRLRAMKDPVAQNAAAVALFGTKAEDLGSALFALDPSTAVAGLGQIGGAADAMNKTFGDNQKGKIDSFLRTMETRFAGVAGAIGPVGAALPALGGLTTVLQSGAAAAVKNTAALVAQKTATVAMSVATKAAAVAQGIFNAVMALNPVVLIVLAVVALVAAIILAYQKVEWFRNFVDAAFRLIGSVISGVVDWVKENWPLLLAILTGPIGIAVLLITRNWDAIKAGFTAVVDWIGNRIGDVVGFFTGLKDKIFDVAHGIFDPIANAWKAVVNGLIGIWNAIDFGIHIRVPDWVPIVGGKGFNVDDIFPDLPTFDGGGVVPGVIGEPQLIVAHGGEEVVTAADRGRRGRGVGDGPLFGPTYIDARGMERPEDVAELQARYVGWQLATAGIR